MSVLTYDPSQVSVIVAGSILKSWEKVEVDFNEDEWTFAEGTSGEATRVKNAGTLGTITVSTPQSSADNDTLAALAIAETLFPILIKDNSGTGIAVMPEATIAKRAKLGLEKVVVDKDWPMQGQLTLLNPGGNS